MALGYSGVVTQARTQQTALITEQRKLRMEDNQDKRETNTEIKKRQDAITKAQSFKNKTGKISDYAAFFGPAAALLGETVEALCQSGADSTIAKLESKVKTLQDNLTERSTTRQTRLDEIDLEITACQEQIKDAKKQGEEATKEMFGANG